MTTHSVARLVVVISASALFTGTSPGAPCEWELQSNTGPSPRYDHTMGYDSGRGVIVLFGGSDHSLAIVGDTWEWNGVTWTLRSNSGPGARIGHGMTYDSVRGTTVLFGGYYTASYLGDTWEWDGTDWMQQNVSGPSPRVNHALSYDSGRGVVVVFGGHDGNSYLGDTREWDGTAWAQRSATGPSPRAGHGMAYDSARGVTVLFGGYAPSADSVVGDTWEWNGVAWSLRSNTGPPARHVHGMTYDSGRRVSIIFGGVGPGITDQFGQRGQGGDTWEWDGAAWELRAKNVLMARTDGALAYDSIRRVVLLFGGLFQSPFSVFYGDTWQFTGMCPCTEQQAVVVNEGGVVFVHVIGPAIDCLPEKASRPIGCPTNGPYVDAWTSAANATMCHNFGAAGHAIPSGFFDMGSDAFTGSVCLEGVPLGEPGFGAADTLIRRADDPIDRCSLPSATPVGVEMEIDSLSLASTSPITVTYNGGQNPEQWNVTVDLSTVAPPAGVVTATKTHCNGGTYTSVLNVQPRFTFAKVGDPETVRVLDTGLAGVPYVELNQQTPAPWVSDMDPNLGLTGDLCSYFHAGISDQVQETDCDCNGNARRDLCDIEEGVNLDCNANKVPDSCDIADATSLDVDPMNGIPDECEIAPISVETDPVGLQSGRFTAIVVPSSGAGRETALRVTLTTLNHPRLCCTDASGASCSATPCDVDSHCSAVPGGNQTCAHQAAAGAPDYSAMEDNIRYVNSFSFPAEGGSLDCANDGPPFNTSYK